MKRKLLIWGASKNSKQLAEVARASGEYEVVAFLDDLHPEREGERLHDVPVLGTVEGARRLLDGGVRHVYVAVCDPATRMRLAGRAREWGFSLATIVHPTAIIARGATIGDGSLIGAHSIVNVDVRVGENVLMYDHVVVGHDSVLGDGVHLGPHVALAGEVTVEPGTWIALGAMVADRVRVGSNVMIGMGSVVVRDVPSNVVAFGSPARVARER
jgi:sugar O-acyltransferase (sialic acid O-acetyltransferase NeuD family)